MKNYVERYIAGKRKNNPSFDFVPNSNREEDVKFTNWLVARKEYKETAKQLTATYVSVDKIDAFKESIKPEIKKMLDSLL